MFNSYQYQNYLISNNINNNINYIPIRTPNSYTLNNINNNSNFRPRSTLSRAGEYISSNRNNDMIDNPSSFNNNNNINYNYNNNSNYTSLNYYIKEIQKIDKEIETIKKKLKNYQIPMKLEKLKENLEKLSKIEKFWEKKFKKQVKEEK